MSREIKMMDFEESVIFKNEVDEFGAFEDHSKLSTQEEEEGIRVNSELCNKNEERRKSGEIVTQNHHLKRHKESMHEGVRYPCDECDYTATGFHNLKRHIRSKH